MPVLGDDLAWALKQAAQLIKQAKQQQGQIIVMADEVGGDKAYKEAAKLKSEGFEISVLGVGTAKGAPIPLPKGGFFKDGQGNIQLFKQDVLALKKLAQVGGGRYVPLVNSNRDIQALLAQLASKQTQKQTAEKRKTTLWLDEGRWIIFLLLPFALLAFRRGWL